MRKKYISPKSEMVKLQLQSNIVNDEYIPITVSFDTDEQLSKRNDYVDVEEEENVYIFKSQKDNAFTSGRFKSLWDE